jgi:glycosyltransferase involved in cell wall biosynthesis
MDSGCPVPFSIVVPAHNAARTIDGCLHSVLSQTCSDFELIVVDDASTDRTLDVVRGFETDQRIHSVKCLTNHGGPSRPRNVGVSLARGELIVFLDSDDLLAPRALEWLAAFFQRTPRVPMAFFNVEVYKDGNSCGPFLTEFDSFWRLARTRIGERDFVIDDPTTYRQLIATNFIRCCGTAVRRGVFDRLGRFDESVTNSDDFDMWVRIARQSAIGFIDRPGGTYCVRADSISSRGPQLIANRIKILEKLEALPQDKETATVIARKLATNHAALAYAWRIRTKLQAARSEYQMSLRYQWNWKTARGWLTTFLGPTLLKRLGRASVQ